MENIETLSLHIKPVDSNEGAIRRAFSLGPMLQSVLMEHIDDLYAEQLHASTLNPYSQYCSTNEKGEIIWRIGALTNDAIEKLIEPASKIEKFTLRNLDKAFIVTRKTRESFGVDRLIEVLKADAPSTFCVGFVSPAAFRSKGRYVIMPDVRLIFQNLLMRYNQVYAGDAEVDPETLDYIVGRVSVSSYNLHSHYFSRTMGESSRIPAFLGSLTLRVEGPQSLRGLVAMLLAFAEVSGIGIKTSMGMGGIQLMNDRSIRKGGGIIGR